MRVLWLSGEKEHLLWCSVSVFAQGNFLFISGFLTKSACKVSFVLKEFSCGLMRFCNDSLHSLKSKNKFFNYFLLGIV
jgi:hypothetical protein